MDNSQWCNDMYVCIRSDSTPPHTKYVYLRSDVTHLGHVVENCFNDYAKCVDATSCVWEWLALQFWLRNGRVMRQCGVARTRLW